MFSKDQEVLFLTFLASISIKILNFQPPPESVSDAVDEVVIGVHLDIKGHSGNKHAAMHSVLIGLTEAGDK